MKEFTYVITDPEGIHARPAGALVKEAGTRLGWGQRNTPRRMSCVR